ncbi:MAG: dihydrodipicolinate synthase family protein [Cellvibrionaceae bacterium]
MDAKIFVPLITPLNDRGQVCKASVASIISSVESFASGYIPCLTSGEGWLLSDTQWKAMVSACVDFSNGRKVIAGIEKPLSKDVVSLAKLAESLGADGVMITTPFGKDVTQQAMYEHFSDVHDAISIEIYIYNENSLSNNTVDKKTLVEVAKLPRVVGIKESMNKDFDADLINSLKNEDIEVYQGWENRIVNDELSDGNICSLSNLFPELCLNAANSENNELAEKVEELCQEYGIYEESWYEHIKSHLFEKKLISTKLVVS